MFEALISREFGGAASGERRVAAETVWDAVDALRMFFSPQIVGAASCFEGGGQIV
jgi:hypothetical protein